MAIGERDPHTGHLTTGHEWNGIKELNTPVPRPVYFFLILTAAVAFILWLLLPAWPLGRTYTRGLLGLDDRATVAEELERAAANREGWAQRVENSDYVTIQSDDQLMRNVRETGRTLFADNCSVCHGAKGSGGPGFPSLANGSPLWGADPETVAETIRVGINSTHPESRTSQMLAFGRDQMLPREDIERLVGYVQGLSGRARVASAQAAPPPAGQELFATNCASCHGETGGGTPEMGVPDLTDSSWIYGGDRQTIFTTVYYGRQGHMPSWEGRLTPLARKLLTLYVVDLRKQKK